MIAESISTHKSGHRIAGTVLWTHQLFSADEELSDRLARLRGIQPVVAVASKKPSSDQIHPEEFLSKFPKITSSSKLGQDANTPVDIQRLLEEVWPSLNFNLKIMQKGLC